MSEISIGDAINKFLKKSRLNTGIQSLKIEQIWETMMGKTIAKYTDKIQIVNKTLFIRTNVGPLKQELMYQKEIIKTRVNEALGEDVINEVVIQLFKQGIFQSQGAFCEQRYQERRINSFNLS